LAEWKHAQVSAIDRGTIQRFLNGQKGKLSRARINLMRMMLSGFFSWAIRAGLIFYNPVKDTEKLRGTPPKVKTINQEQASLLLAVADERWRPHLLTLYLNGLRIGELRGLTWDDYSTTRRTLRIRKTVYKQGADMLRETDEPFSLTKSTRGERLIRLSPLAADVLDDWKASGWWSEGPNPYDLVFPSSQGNPLNDNTLREALTRAADTARKRWSGREPFPKRLTPHTLRHGWARMMLEAGLRLPELLELGGWSNLEQVRVYTAWEISADDKAADLQSRFLGGNFGGMGDGK
jgi:integrase